MASAANYITVTKKVTQSNKGLIMYPIWVRPQELCRKSFSARAGGQSLRFFTDTLFPKARTHSAWSSEPVPPALLRKVYELARLGPTSANAFPARFLFLTTPEAKKEKSGNKKQSSVR